MANLARSSIELWTKGDMQHETLIRNKARQRNEPWALWPRQARLLFISDLAALPLQDLYALQNDMRVEIAELNGMIDAEHGKLALLSADQPAAINATKFTIKKITKKKAKIKLIMLEAVRLRKLLNQEANKPKQKRKKIVTSQQDYNSHDILLKKMEYFKRKKMFSLVRAEIGDAKMDKLADLACYQAIPLFEEWAASVAAKAELVQHIVKYAHKSLFTTPRNSP